MGKRKIFKIVFAILSIFLCVVFYELLGICVAYKKQPEVSNTTKVSNQLRVPSKTKPRIVAGFKTSCNGLDIFLEFQAPREAVHPESLNLCHSYVWEFR